MKVPEPKISVIIVSYNVRAYLQQALYSLRRALAGIAHEIFVVDNASVDGTLAMLRQHFPEVIVLENRENVGFGRANNQALARARGEFVVMINPDTVVQEDTFRKLLAFFEHTPDAAAATCKIINPDGSFSVDCRHAIPTPMIAFWKVTGLSRLFPRSKLFGQYNLTYLDPNQTYPVPAISGSFMMVKRRVLEEVGFFDERFFMYCEDIDLCYRINLKGYKIYYVPTTQIIHYKGESTKKNNLDYVVTFNRALYQFFQKYYAASYGFLIRWIIVLGIVLRGIFIFFRNFIKEHFPVLLDTLILNLVILLAFVVRMEIKDHFSWEGVVKDYWIIHLFSTVLFLASGVYLQVYPRHRLSVQAIVKANLMTFVLLASITFFFKQFAYSRLVVLGAALFSPLGMVFWRAVLKRHYRGDREAWGKDVFSKPTVVVGEGPETVHLYRKIRELHDLSYELIGVVAPNQESKVLEEAGIPVLGTLEHLPQMIPMYGIRQVIFASEKLSYENILKAMSSVRTPRVEFKIAPSSMEVVIGKSYIERLDDYPLLDVEYALGNPLNRFLKRLLDVLVAGVYLLVWAPIALPGLLWCRRRLTRVAILGPQAELLPILQIDDMDFRRFLNRYLIFFEVLRGRVSLIGMPIQRYRAGINPPAYWHRPGLTGLVQINQQKIHQPEDAEKYHFFYVKNQSLLLDLEILIKALWQRILFRQA